MRKVFIILTLIGITLTAGLCLTDSKKIIKADTTIFDDYTTNHSINSDFSDRTSNHTDELDPLYINAVYDFDYGLTPKVNVTMYLVSEISHFTNAVTSVMYNAKGNPYASFNDSTTDADSDGDGDSDEIIHNIIGSVSDNIFTNFGYVDTCFDSYYSGGLGSRITSWYVNGD